MYRLEALDKISGDVEKYGGKAVFLSQLIQCNFTVPYGVVISSDIYQKYRNTGLEKSFFDNIESQIENIFLQRSKRIIFRSSANIENSDEFSSAGVFSSYVYDSKISIKEHIEKVWRSSADIYANNYFDLVEIDKDSIKMSVIVQEYIEGKLTLVIQSYDMINDIPQILIEYTDKGASCIVDGTTNADSLYINYNGQFIGGVKNNLVSENLLFKIASDCKRMEDIFGAHVEIEAQILDNDIYYLQVRKLL